MPVGKLWASSLRDRREGVPVSYTHLTLPTKSAV